VNDQSGVQRHVKSESASSSGAASKEAVVSDIRLADGDVLRAYATYTFAGAECDTVLYTFSTPDGQESTAHRTLDAQRKREEAKNRPQHDEL
jgi:hypothetical protein